MSTRFNAASLDVIARAVGKKTGDELRMEQTPAFIRKTLPVPLTRQQFRAYRRTMAKQQQQEETA
jgi:hypothetical protein